MMVLLIDALTLLLHKMEVISQKIVSDAFSRKNFFCILIKISLKFVPKGQINNNPALV